MGGAELSNTDITELIENEEHVQTRDPRYPKSDSELPKRLTSAMLRKEVEGKRKAKGFTKEETDQNDVQAKMVEHRNSILDNLETEFNELGLSPGQRIAVRKLLLKASYANGLTIAIAIVEVLNQLKKPKTVSMGA
jgi:hypothetical protein